MNNKIIELRKQGYSIKRIAKELNMSTAAISYHVNKYNLGGNINNKHIDVDKNVINQIIELKKNKIPLNEICMLIPLPPDKVKNISRSLDMDNIYDNDELLKEINEYYANVKSIKKCCEYFNLSLFVIRKIVKVDKIKRRFVKNSDYVTSWRKRLKIMLVEYKGGKCEICGYNKSYRALQFHHNNPNEKDYAISNKHLSFDKMKIEVDKCMLICANCHQELHEKIDIDNNVIKIE